MAGEGSKAPLICRPKDLDSGGVALCQHKALNVQVQLEGSGPRLGGTGVTLMSVLEFGAQEPEPLRRPLELKRPSEHRPRPSLGPRLGSEHAMVDVGRSERVKPCPPLWVPGLSAPFLEDSALRWSQVQSRSRVLL